MATKQFQATIKVGQTHTWFVWGISERDFLTWMVRPLPGSGRPLPTGDEVHWSVTLERVRVEAEGDGSYTHFLTVRGDAVARTPPGVLLGGGLFTFEGFYAKL